MARENHVYSVWLKDRDDQKVHGPFLVQSHRTLSNKQIEEAAQKFAAAEHGKAAKRWGVADFTHQQTS